MAWIESHQSLLTHRKLLHLARELGIQKYQAVGHLESLWWWAIDNATDGSLDGTYAYDIAAAAGWDDHLSWWHGLQTNSPTGCEQIMSIPFFVILVKTGWIDLPGEKSSPIEGRFSPDEPLPDGTRIHDWLDYCGDLVKKRLEKKAEQQQKSGALQEQLTQGKKSPPIKGRKVPPTVPYRTVPYHKEEVPPTPLPPQPKDTNTFKSAPGTAQRCLERAGGMVHGDKGSFLLSELDREFEVSDLESAGEILRRRPPRQKTAPYFDGIVRGNGGNNGYRTDASTPQEHLEAAHRVNPIREPTVL